MNKAIIIGAFGFLGYSVCRAMLDEGIEVNAIPVGKELDNVTEEKRMEIGRNANFLEDQLLIEDKREAPIPVIIPFCDFYMLEMEELLFEHHFLQEELLSLTPENHPIILLLPEQLGYGGSPEIEPLAKLKQNLTKKGFLLKEVLVPTLYGPWQPEGCFFQQLLSLGEDTITVPTLNIRECTSDAIYVADAASVVRGLLEEGHEGKYVLRSGETNSWRNCLKSIYDSLLTSKYPGKEKRPWETNLENMKNMSSPLNQVQKLSGAYQEVYVKEPMDILEGLKKQRNHYLRVSSRES
jgi:hypothetical protein